MKWSFVENLYYLKFIVKLIYSKDRLQNKYINTFMLFTKLLDVLCVAGCTLGYNSEQNMESSALSLNSIFIKKERKNGPWY